MACCGDCAEKARNRDRMRAAGVHAGMVRTDSLGRTITVLGPSTLRSIDGLVEVEIDGRPARLYPAHIGRLGSPA